VEEGRMLAPVGTSTPPQPLNPGAIPRVLPRTSQMTQCGPPEASDGGDLCACGAGSSRSATP
jgi:hypothetical protein